MTFKTYCKLMFHTLVCFAIVTSLPILGAIVFYNLVPSWATILISLALLFPTIYWMFKYIWKYCDTIF